MKFVHANTRMIVPRTVNIIDGPRIPHPDSSVRGKEVELTKVVISYAYVNNSWMVASNGVQAEGWNVKLDGTTSNRRWSGTLHMAPERTERGWLRKLIDGARPTGAPAFPFDVAEV